MLLLKMLSAGVITDDCSFDVGAGFTGCPTTRKRRQFLPPFDGGGLPAEGGAKGDQGLGWG